MDNQKNSPRTDAGNTSHEKGREGQDKNRSAMNERGDEKDANKSGDAKNRQDWDSKNTERSGSNDQRTQGQTTGNEQRSQGQTTGNDSRSQGQTTGNDRGQDRNSGTGEYQKRPVTMSTESAMGQDKNKRANREQDTEEDGD